MPNLRSPLLQGDTTCTRSRNKIIARVDRDTEERQHAVYASVIAGVVTIIETKRNMRFSKCIFYR